jgi:predicted HicB family RNase H-like nuclease
MNKSRNKEESSSEQKIKKSQSYKQSSQSLPPGKESLKTLYLRLPKSFWEDIQTIADLTGLSMNAVCIDLLRPALKTKLRQLSEE